MVRLLSPEAPLQPPPLSPLVTWQQVAEEVPSLPGAGGRLALSGGTAPRLLHGGCPGPHHPRSPATQRGTAPPAPPAGLRLHLQRLRAPCPPPPPPAPSALVAQDRVAVRSRGGPIARRPWVSGLLRLSLRHPASAKMNVRRVESISAQLEEASSTGGRMRWACERAPRWHRPSLAVIACPFHARGGVGGGTLVAKAA